MSNDNFYISKVEIANLASELDKDGDEAKMLIEAIYSNHKELANDWRDDSQVAYDNVSEADKASFNRLLKSVHDTSICLKSAVSIHGNTEEENAAAARNLGNM